MAGAAVFGGRDSPAGDIGRVEQVNDRGDKLEGMFSFTDCRKLQIRQAEQ